LLQPKAASHRYGYPACSPLFCFPLDLELYFFFLRRFFVLYCKRGARRDVNSFSGDLNGKALVVFNGVSQTTQLGYKLLLGIFLFDISVLLLVHFFISPIFY